MGVLETGEAVEAESDDAYQKSLCMAGVCDVQAETLMDENYTAATCFQNALGTPEHKKNTQKNKDKKQN